MKKRPWNTWELCLCGMMIAVAFVISYLEWLLPEFLVLPGAKPGFANVIIIVALLCFGPRTAGVVNLLRILLVTATFGNWFAFAYSLAGATLSLLAMMLLKKTGWFGIIGMSVAGGVCHNLGQLGVAVLILENISPLYLLPYWILLGMVTGACMGVLASGVIRCIKVR